MVQTRLENGQHQNSSSGNTVGTERLQEKNQDDQGRTAWVNVIKRDLENMDLTWEEAEVLANDKAESRRRVAQCSHPDAG